MASDIQILYALDFKDGNPEGDSQELGRIAVGPATGGQLKTLINHEQLPDGIDVVGETIFWTQMGTVGKNDGRVQSAALDGTGIKDIYKTGEIHTPKQVVIDRTNHKLYVCDREGLRVHRSNLDGSDKEVLIKRGDWQDHMDDKNLHCVGIAVDAAHGKFYWTQKGPSKGGSGHIFRANIQMPAGKDAETRDDIELLFKDLPEPIDLEIDSETQTLYWSDRGEEPKGNTINKADVGAPGQYSIIAKYLHEAIGIQVDEKNKHIYASDLGGSIYRYDMDGKNKSELYKNQGAFTGIALTTIPAQRAKELYGIEAV